MNPGTAANRLVKDILFKFVVAAGYMCHRCGKPLTRKTFSIDHKEVWLHSEDPVKLFFDLENISFSHQKCNSDARRIPHKKYATHREKKRAEKARRRERNGHASNH